MIFNEILFEFTCVEELYKTTMNGLNDNTLKNFYPVALSSAFKKDNQINAGYNEFIHSYIESAKIVSKHLENQNTNTPGIDYVFRYSLMPSIIFLCRHSLELSIKYTISKLNKEFKAIHNLHELWTSFYKDINQHNISEQEKMLLDKMSDFIEAMNNLDEKGTMLRYPVDKNDKFTQEFLWANPIKIVEITESFINQLLSINIENKK